MVIDTSALLALFFKENHGSWVANRLKDNQGSLVMSTVNLTEVLILLKDKKPETFLELRKEVLNLPIQFIPPTVTQAQKAAEARLEFNKLNFGDCFAYALASEQKDSLLTLDSDFEKSDVVLVMP